MLRRLKPLILFFLLAAMSLRGMAAVDMWHCPQDQGGAIITTMSQHAQHHGMSGERVTDHAGHGEKDAAAQTDGADESAQQTGAHCISGAAATVERISFSFAPAGANRIPFVEQKFVAVVPAQLDRPPLVQSL